MFKILCLVALVAVFAVPSDAVFNQRLMLLVRPKLIQCAKDNHVSDADLQAIIANNLTNQGRDIQCMSLCFMNKLGMLDANGNINVCASKVLFSFGENPFFVNRVVDTCKNLKGTDACSTAGLIYACYVKNKLL